MSQAHLHQLLLGSLSSSRHQQMPEATNARTSKALPSLLVPSASVGTGLVQREPGRDECPPPPRWHRTPGEPEGITREVMKSSLVSMSGVRRHARNLREVLDWRSCRTPGERQRGRSALARHERDPGRDLPTSAAS